MNFEIISIFPDFFTGPFSHGIVFQAQKRGLIQVGIHDLRDFSTDRHRTVDDRPFGGGAGMVLKPEPLFRAVRKIQTETTVSSRKVILLTPQGKRFEQRLAAQFSELDQAVLICGRYEGVDERVTDCLVDVELSIGDYVLSGGELAACVFVDAVTRLLPGVLNNSASAVNESFARLESPLAQVDSAVLDYPHYTRPEDFEGRRVPEVLLCGDHKRIERWRRKRAIEKTLKNRPDLLQYAALSEEDKQLLG